MPELLEIVQRHCPEVDTALMRCHFRCLPAAYFARYPAGEIARHLRLLDGLAPGQRVDVAVRPRNGILEVLVAGEDHAGTLACISAAVAAEGFDVEDVEAATYHEPADRPLLFVVILRVRGLTEGRAPADLAAGLRRRLRGALACLAAGNFMEAQTVAASDAVTPGPASVTPLSVRRIGTVLGSDFRLERPLMLGGTSEVYLATQVSLDRTIAVKISRFEGAADDELIALFSQEALVLARFDCPHIVQVHAAGTVPGPGGGVLGWIAVEYLAGGDLARWLQQHGPPFHFAARWFRQALEGLRYAHRQGILHRDLKPHNLLLTSDGNLKVTDFGLLQRTQRKPTAAARGRIMGTPHYMSPEQARGEPVDERSDIFSLGTTFHHLLSGRLPFQAETLTSLLGKIADEESPRLAEIALQAPRPLTLLIDRMMARRREDRYQSVDVVLAELASYEDRGLLCFDDDGTFDPLPPPQSPLALEGETEAWQAEVT
jgi:hypothetical protein